MFNFLRDCLLSQSAVNASVRRWKGRQSVFFSCIMMSKDDPRNEASLENVVDLCIVLK